MRRAKSVVFPEYDLGERVKYLRGARGLSQAELAESARVSQPTIAQIELGKKDPSVETLRRVARALDVEVASLFASDEIFVFDLKRLRRKYRHVDELTPHLYAALAKVVRWAGEIGM